MQKQPLKILVACASGIATSTLAAAIVQEVLADAGFKCDITKGAMLNVPSMAIGMDLVLTTGKYNEEIPVPVLSVTSFITGINDGPTKKKLVEMAGKIVGAM